MGERRTFVQQVFQILHVSQSLVIWFDALQSINLRLELRPDIWSPGKHMEGVAQQTGGCVSSCKKNVQKLVS